MENRLRNTIDKIHAENALKEKTAIFLREEIRKCGQKRRISGFRTAAACVSLVLLLAAGSFSYILYITPSAFVDMDVNPSIELALNRFGRVLEASPYNDDGAVILQDADVENKKYEQAIQILLDEMIRQNYLKPDGLVSVTVQANNSGAEQRMLGTIQASVDASLDSHLPDTATDVFAVSSEVRECAREYNLSPAKYLAITHLQEVDPEATYDGCAEHSISEIRRLTEEHGGGHHETEGGDEAGSAGQTTAEQDAQDYSAESVSPEDTFEHHRYQEDAIRHHEKEHE